MSERKDTLELSIRQLAMNARDAALELGVLSTDKKNEVLKTLAELLLENQQSLLEANELDLQAGQENGLSKPLLDRLRFTPDRIQQMADGVLQVADLPDPVGELIDSSERPNGLVLNKVRVPIGVIGIIYESRPNVTIDCAVLCFKSGNACVLRGGKEAFHSNRALGELIHQALAKHEINPNVVSLIPTTDREALNYLLKLDDCVHCIIPRGGEGLIRFVAEHARMPVIKHYKGVCNLYLDAKADPAMAVAIAVNAKCQRPSVCNAIENLIVHQNVVDRILPDVAKALIAEGVTLRCDEEAAVALEKVGGMIYEKAAEEDFYEEFLDLIIAVKVVADLDEAIQAVNLYGSGHSDSIITEDAAAAELFMAGVDSSTVYWNASTRFTDGYEFGLGAEIGISTDKLHARGPMGLKELTTYKYKVLGKGQVR